MIQISEQVGTTYVRRVTLTSAANGKFTADVPTHSKDVIYRAVVTATSTADSGTSIRLRVTPPPAPGPALSATTITVNPFVAAPRTRANFPTAATTGVPRGTTLKSSGSVTVTKAGTVLNALDVTGTITVEADNVIIRNTRIRSAGGYPIRVKGGRNLVVEDTEIDGRSKADAAVAFNHYTLRRVHIHHAGEGPRIAGGHVTIEDSLIDQLVQVGNNHTDALQAVSGRNIVVRGNVIEVYNPATGLIGNAAFQYGEEEGVVADCTFEDNYFNGGNYTINGGGGKTTGAACTFRHNVMGRNHRYGAVGNLGKNSEWASSNVWVGTNTAVVGGTPQPGRVTTLTGVAAGGRAHTRTVTLQQLKGSTWTNVASATTTTSGAFSLPVATVAGRYSYRVVAAATAHAAASTSAIVRHVSAG